MERLRLSESYQETFSIKRLWLILAVSVVVMFSILLLIGREIYQVAPPIPTAVTTVSGEVIFTKEDIQTGQNVWQSTGGMQQGSIWGHGSYVAPDWSADWLQREALAHLELIKLARSLDDLPTELANETHRAELRLAMRENTYDETSGAITISDRRAAAIRVVADHYDRLFRADGEEYLHLREEYAMPLRATLTRDETHAISAFVFWTSWSASTNRPGKSVTYTSNWPHEPLVGNTPTPSILIWSIASVMLLLAGIGGIVWYYAKQYDIWRDHIEPEDGIAKTDIMESSKITPSMRATAKYFWLITALFVGQVLLGILTAHYGVEGQGLYGLPLVDYLPYVVSRTWHTQLAVYWIATAWLATGLYVAPLLSGKDPRFQVWGVNFLFISLVIIVVGSFIGEWASVHRFFGEDLTASFWFGHQGYEFVDLGRFWQIYLFVGLILWVGLVLRAIYPALVDRRGGLFDMALDSRKHIIFLLAIATICIGLLYGAGFFWGQHTHISVMNYWRWWIVHLWVEGVFEVFAATLLSILFIHMGLLRVRTAITMILFTTIIFLMGGVLGTLHHLYFAGTPTSVIALGATFSALEVVPLVVIGFEVYNHAKIEHQAEWEINYRWPFMFFSAVLFWNLLGAGIFGFLINPPIALYYMQGMNLTANHAHTALFGVYGMMAIGLTLYCMRGLTDLKHWNLKLLKFSFWSLNIGLGMMAFLSLLPQGVLQTFESITNSYASARSAEFIHSPTMELLVWMRVPGDLVFSFGVMCFALFVFQAFNRKTQSKTDVPQVL